MRAAVVMNAALSVAVRAVTVRMIMLGAGVMLMRLDHGAHRQVGAQMAEHACGRHRSLEREDERHEQQQPDPGAGHR